MSKLILNQTYGVVYGHDSIRYTQGGKNFNAQHNEIVPEAPAKVPLSKAQKDGVAPVTPLSNAKAFLLQILKENPVSKSAIYKEAESNNQDWNSVRDAAIELGIAKFNSKNLEMWKLPEVAA